MTQYGPHPAGCWMLGRWQPVHPQAFFHKHPLPTWPPDRLPPADHSVGRELRARAASCRQPGAQLPPGLSHAL